MAPQRDPVNDMHTFIIGNTGSGKSTLAHHLAERFGLSHVDLDEFAWAETPGIRRELAEALDVVRPKLAQPCAVEGMYADLVEGLLAESDRLVWLDLPIEQCEAHCRARPFEPHKWESAEKQNAFLPRLLEFLRDYEARDGALGREAHRALFEGFSGDKRRCVSVGDMRRFADHELDRRA